MNKDQFIYWLKGFTRAVNEEGPTPKQWETIVSELNQIKDCPDFGSPIGIGGTGTVNTTGVIIDGFIQNQSITRANPPSTLTTTSYPSGSTINYTIKDDSKNR